MAQTLLAVSNLETYYGPIMAIRGVSFAVPERSVVTILGANGAGKSTILKLLGGIMPPTSGRIVVNGRLSALIEVSAGFHPDLTGRENIYLNGTILGMTRREIKRKFDDIVEFAGLAEFIDTPVKRYSSGMYARLGFSVAAHVEPDLLIVDEVLSVGDYLFQQKCVDRMSEILTSGATVVFVSHNLHAVAGLCRRSLLLERGRVLSCGPTTDVIRQYLELAREKPTGEQSRVEIEHVAVRHAKSGRGQFETGDTALIDVTLLAHADSDDVTPVIQIVDENSYPVFDTDTARLSGSVASLRAGERLVTTFEIALHLAAGTYHLNAFAHEYVTNRAFSTWRTAATFFVGETRTIKGLANLYPRLAEYRVKPAPTKPVVAPERGAQDADVSELLVATVDNDGLEHQQL